MKTARLNLRRDARQDAIIRRAAEQTGTNVSDFVVHAATSEPERAIADPQTIMLDPAAWAEFTAILDRPPRENPKLRALFERPEAFEQSGYQRPRPLAPHDQLDGFDSGVASLDGWLAATRDSPLQPARPHLPHRHR